MKTSTAGMITTASYMILVDSTAPGCTTAWIV